MEILKDITHCQPACFVRVPTPEVSPHVVAGTPFGFHVAAGSPPASPRQKSPSRIQKITNDANDNVINGITNTAKAVSLEDNSGAQKGTGSASAGKGTGEKEVKDHSSDSSQRHGKVFCMSIPPTTCQAMFEQLCKLGYLTSTPGMRNISQNIVEDYFEVDSILVPEFSSFMQCFISFSEQTMQRYLVNAVTVLNHTHIRCLQTFIICAFDMARDVLVTPKKIQFAKEKEDDLFNSLYQIAVDKGDEIQTMIEQTLADSKDKLIEKVDEYDFIGKDTLVCFFL